MPTARAVPPVLEGAVHRWQSVGSPVQPPSHWSLVRWQAQFPDRADYLSTLPRPISRAEVIIRCADATAGREQATRAFIASMIWGYGTVGYGPFRTLRVLSENPDVGDRLAQVARIAKDEGGVAAFRWLAQGTNRLRWLGVAFATKYLYFCAAAGDGQPALVLDRLVRDWMATNLGWLLSLQWDVQDYREYVDTMCGWAEVLAIEPGDLEMLVFQLAANDDPRSLWSAPELFAAATPETAPVGSDEEPDKTTLIEMLDAAAALYADLSATGEPHDRAEFDRGIAALKRIVLAQT